MILKQPKKVLEYYESNNSELNLYFTNNLICYQMVFKNFIIWAIFKNATSLRFSFDETWNCC